MSNGIAAPVIAGLAIGIGFVVSFSVFVSSSSTSSFSSISHYYSPSGYSISITKFNNGTNTNNNPCGEPIETVKKNALFTILLPAKLPAGYSLQSVDYTPPNTVYLQYFTKSICDPNNSPASPEEGFIEIVQSPLSKVSNAKTGEEYVQKAIAIFSENGIEAKSYVFQNGRMYAVGYEAGVGTSRAIDENGDIVHQTRTDYAAHLWIVDDKTGTIAKIAARSTDMPLEEALVPIAESLTEY